MPFDGEGFGEALTRVQKLMILRDLLDGATDDEQNSWKSCLWHRAAHCPALVAAGFPTKKMIGAFAGVTYLSGLRVLGFKPGEGAPFGKDAVAAKRDFLDKLIAKEKAHAV